MILVFDLETQKSSEDVGGWKYIDKMLVSCAVAQVSWDRGSTWETHTFLEDQVRDLLKLIAKAHGVVTYNGNTFDKKVLSYYTDQLKDDDLEAYEAAWEFRSVDLCRLIQKANGKMVGLGAVAEATLNQGKSGDGLEAVKLYAEQRFQELLDYCEQDTVITRRLWEHANDYGWVLVPMVKGKALSSVGMKRVMVDVGIDEGVEI